MEAAQSQGHLRRLVLVSAGRKLEIFVEGRAFFLFFFFLLLFYVEMETEIVFGSFWLLCVGIEI